MSAVAMIRGICLIITVYERRVTNYANIWLIAMKIRFSLIWEQRQVRAEWQWKETDINCEGAWTDDDFDNHSSEWRPIQKKPFQKRALSKAIVSRMNSLENNNSNFQKCVSHH